ncbi:MAG TPA: response regulator transcription factor [Vicinamibacterales bacterium]
MRVLVVEDDPQISHFVVRGLREEGHLVELVEDGHAAESRAAGQHFDAMLLDLMLPGLDGMEVCRRLREAGVDTPILMVTARDAINDRVTGLDVGADDYLTKPFAFAELLARLRALTRRGRTRHLSAVLRYGPIVVDTQDRVVRVNGGRIDLTATEYRLLEFLVRRAESVVSRDELAERVWGIEHDPDSNVVDVYIAYVRKKLQRRHEAPLIQTIRGLGYMLKEASDS